MKSIKETQSGAVLIVSLIILLALTIIGITSMNNAIMEEKMSGNAMNHDIVFHAAESAIEAALADTTLLSNAIVTGDTITVTADLGDAGISSSADIVYINAGPALGYSLGENNNAFSSYRFDTIGTGSKASSSATTTVTQGVSRIGPNI